MQQKVGAFSHYFLGSLDTRLDTSLGIIIVSNEDVGDLIFS